MKKFFKRLFRRPAILLVTIWANRAYRQGVKAAEARRLQEIRSSKDLRATGNCMIYLAANSFRPDHLVTYNKRQFKAEKRVYGMAARLLTMNTLKNGCYYHTADRWGENGMGERDREIRRRAFIKERLSLAGLLH